MTTTKDGECAWTRRTCEALTRLGCKVRAIVATRRQQPGWPDRWLCHERWHGHLEFKGVETKLTTLQRIVIREINLRQPGTAFVVRRAGPDADAGYIEDHDENELWRFDDAAGLLEGLATLRLHYVNNARKENGQTAL